MRTALFLAAALVAASAARADEPAAPASGGKPSDTYAQHLVDAALKAHPDVVIMAMHVTPPDAKDNVIIASNIGRIGKKADDDDLRVIATGLPNLEVDKAGDRFEVEEPLKDVGGDIIGAVGIVFAYKAGDDKEARHSEADAIAAALARRIAHARNLLDPWPYDASFSDRTAAQALVDRTLARHPDVLILALHATPPGSNTNVILGSNIGRIGKKADDDDLRVIDRGDINREVNGARFEAEIPLNNSAGDRIGALGVVFSYRDGDDKEALVKRAEAIRDEMAADIASPAALVRSPS
jgi:hypothetical protein